MNFKQKLFYAVAGFLVGNLLLATVAFGIFYLPKTIYNAPNAPPLFYLFQILFWLFLISPPVIVVLLLVIIKKMDSKDKLK